MKTQLFVFVGLITIPTVYSQTVANYNSTSGLLGLVSPNQKYSVGLQHEYNSFSIKGNHPGHAGSDNNYFHTFNLTGRIKSHKRVEILINFPIHYHLQERENGNRELAGPGDLTILTRYQVLRTSDSSKRILQHSLLFGGGIKLPTGRYNMYDDNGFYDRYMQPGTGSWDVLLNGQYVAKWRAWGLNATFDAKISTNNADNYQYGHKVNTGIKAFYFGKGEHVFVLASGGILYNYTSKDYYMRQYQPNSGGHLLAANLSADFYIKRFVLGIDFKIPVYTQLAGGSIGAGPQVTSQLMINF